MPSYIVTAQEGKIEEAKKQAQDQGGKIVHDLAIINGFSVEFPEGTVHTLAESEHVKDVEQDGEVKTQ